MEYLCVIEFWKLKLLVVLLNYKVTLLSLIDQVKSRCERTNIIMRVQ